MDAQAEYDRVMEAYAPTRPRFLALQVALTLGYIGFCISRDINWAFGIGILTAIPLLEYRKYRVRRNAQRFLEKSKS